MSEQWDHGKNLIEAPSQQACCQVIDIADVQCFDDPHPGTPANGHSGPLARFRTCSKKNRPEGRLGGETIRNLQVDLAAKDYRGFRFDTLGDQHYTTESPALGSFFIFSYWRLPTAPKEAQTYLSLTINLCSR